MIDDDLLSGQKPARPSLHWLTDGDWFRRIAAAYWLLLGFMSIAFCVYALFAFARGELGTAIIMALLAVVLKPAHGWWG